ncbi:MAG: UvrD-helicase domain-containing protein, partial [Flavobacteriaceae bacterium]|nr:UvrD-helicase domain-containing protein [Flavobacteriaceae bacterium]
MTTNFHIYNASAGSGKTFTLTSRVLVKIIKSKEEDAFKGILALTFTNKAADEMKTRILTGLQEFTDLKNINQPSELFKQVKKEVGLGSKEICNISKRRLSLLLHNFSFFQVSTLDSFNHNIIRAFSKELNLVSDFKVIIDSEDFINEAVERLLAQTGEEKKTSNALIDFANKKIKEGKTWDISFDLRELAKTLTNENHYIHIKKLESRTSEDFINEKNEINKRLAALNLEKIALTKQMEMIINSEEKEIIFSRNSFPKFLIKLKNKKWTLANITTISNYFENRTLITKKCLTENPENAEKVFKSLYEGFKKIKNVLFDVTMAKAFSLAITPASVLSLIKKTSKEMQDERGELLLSEFNQRICEEIKDHPAPYIYEKIGTKFKDYMIDEFQDTSFLQWSNLIPLISHSLESEEMAGKQGSLLLVGDPKQSVYRWRAADPNIFISLLLKANPFNVAKSNKTLPKNFRSNKEIVKFNNGFFQHLSEIMESPINKQIYQLGVEQK